jgi:hypothetical protein
MSLTQPKLTDWFPACVKPARIGCYQVGYIEENESSVSPYSYSYALWNGEVFMGMGDRASDVRMPDYVSISLNEPDNYWRGLAVKP